MSLSEPDVGESTVVGRHLLLDDVRFNGDAQMIRLRRQVSGGVVIGAVVFEGTVPGVAPTEW